MLVMENAEEVMQILERFTKLKQKDIPKELEDYLSYVAKTGDTVYTWSNIKYLFREKLVHVIKEFHDTTSNIDDLPQYPNVDPFNYETMKSALLERLDLFSSAPFTIQRLCELLTDPKKQYSRIDKYMRALEKNILVVSTIEPGRKQPESENGDSLDSVVNGDLSLDVNIDVEIDMANEAFFTMQHQLRNNATSSANTTTNPNNKPITNEDDIDATAGDLINTKKPKLELEKSVTTPATTAETTPTVAIPNTETSNILNEQHKSDSAESSDDSDSQESKEEINKNENCEFSPSINDENKQKNLKTDDIDTKKSNDEKLETKINEKDTAATDTVKKEDSINPTDITEDEILSEEKNENNENIKLTEDNDEPLSAEEEEKLLNVDDDLDSKPSEIDNKPIENKPITKETPKTENKDALTVTVKESSELDENVTKEVGKIEPQAQNQSVIEENPEKKSDIESQIKETESKTKKSIEESIPTQIGKTVENTKILEKMSVEDVTITSVNVSVPSVENVTTTATIADVQTNAHTDGQSDHPMDDSVTDETIMQTSETEMATDVEVSSKVNDKPDLTGMDIDDTSQEEAMDQ